MRLLIMFYLGLLLFGCAGAPTPKPAIVEKPVYLKCQIPEIPPADLEKVPENATYPEKLKIILNNCLKIQRENQLLREAIKTCQ